tara:strand:+ start:428 stop:685 length:258 start_codon:yes stop_codon:yes gene_type:complete
MNRKSIHINLTLPTHVAFKIVAAKNHLSMQELFEEFARQIIEGDARMLEIVEDLKDRKIHKLGMKFASTDKEGIFDAIQHENPMS